MSNGKNKKSGQRYSGIQKHKRFKSKLITPIKQLNVQPIEWIKRDVPEILTYLKGCKGAPVPGDGNSVLRGSHPR
jgi:hypothetical protein